MMSDSVTDLWHGKLYSPFRAKDSKYMSALFARFMTAFKGLKLGPQQLATMRQQVNLSPESVVATILATMINGQPLQSGNTLGALLIAELIRPHKAIPALAGELQRELEAKAKDAASPKETSELHALAIEEAD